MVVVATPGGVADVASDWAGVADTVPGAVEVMEVVGAARRERAEHLRVRLERLGAQRVETVETALAASWPWYRSVGKGKASVLRMCPWGLRVSGWLSRSSRSAMWLPARGMHQGTCLWKPPLRAEQT